MSDVINDLLVEELAQYDKTIAAAEADTALSDSGRQRVVECCLDAKGAVRKFAGKLSTVSNGDRA